MSLVALVSGGLDSTLMTVLAVESGLVVYPLFVDYGQRSGSKELSACWTTFKKMGLPKPEVVDLSALGRLIPCGLTNDEFDINIDAFLPGRNMYFLLLGASYAYRMNANSVAIGLLDEKNSIFPDQTKSFIYDMEETIARALGKRIIISTPLMAFSKQDVVALARKKGISGTYSCHAGTEKPCGVCIACREYENLEVI